MTSSPYKLYYWPHIPGRGEIIRMLLELGAVPYEDVGKTQGMDALMTGKSADRGSVHFAFPILEVSESLSLSQTVPILAYIGQQHGMAPEGNKAFIALQICATAMDVTDEIHNTHHPVDKTTVYEDQKAEAKRAAECVTKKRLGPFMDYLEKCVTFHGDDATPFVFGEKACYVDVAITSVLRGIQHAFPKTYKETLVARMPKLLKLRAAIENDERVAAFLKSDRSVPFADGIFRYYPELEA